MAARPHEAPDCSCAACVAHDLGPEMWADFERLGVPYAPWMGKHLRQVARESDEAVARVAPVARAMGAAAARWADNELARLLGQGAPPE